MEPPMPEPSDHPGTWKPPESLDLKLLDNSVHERHLINNDFGGGDVAATTTRIVFTAISLACTIVLSAMLGSRAHVLFHLKQLRKLPFPKVLVFMLYICGLSFVVITAMLDSGLDLRTDASCYVSIYICLIFYVGCKMTIQLFLVERAHAARYMQKQRRKDWIWVTSIIVITLGFGSITVVAFLYRIAELSHINGGGCTIGLPVRVTIPLLSYEIFINLGLTGMFIGLLRQILQMREPVHATVGVSLSNDRSSRYFEKIAKTILRCHPTEGSSSSLDVMTADPNLKALKKLICKSVLGAGLVLISTMVNLGLLYRWKGYEQGWLCFNMCTIDVTWSVGVVHFLTVNRKEDGVVPAGAGRSVESVVSGTWGNTV